jgi:uncharacterized RDD family membrane protein YckC
MAEDMVVVPEELLGGNAMDVANQNSVAAIVVARPTFASFWRRFVASLIDGTLIQLFSAIAGTVLAAVVLSDLPVVEVLYSILFIAFGGTPGMHMLGMRVIDRQGNPPGIKRSILRFLIPAASLAPWYIFWFGAGEFVDAQIAFWIVLSACSIGLVFLDAFWMIWDDQKQMLHDKLAKTWIIRV